MESERFDALTRSVASRRSLMTKAGGGGLGAVLLGTLGLREAAAASTCLLDVRLFVRLGPSAGFPLVPKQTKTGQLVGQLRLKISSKGDLAGSTFALADGTSFPVSGSIAGHQIGVRIVLAQGQTLVLQGVDDSNVTACKGSIDGGLVGPKEGDIGDWHAIVVPVNASPTAGTSTSAGVSATSTPIPATSGSGSNGSTGGSGAPTATEAPPTDTSVPDTPTPTPTEVDCGECASAERPAGQPFTGCTPLADNTPCSTGLCCGGVCGDLSNNPNHCGTCGNVCVSGCCHGGVCCPLCDTGQTLCGMTCVDTSSDPSNCGSCGHACASDATCTAGVCKKPVVVCPPGQRNCGGVCVKTPNCP